MSTTSLPTEAKRVLSEGHSTQKTRTMPVPENTLDGIVSDAMESLLIQGEVSAKTAVPEGIITPDVSAKNGTDDVTKPVAVQGKKQKKGKKLRLRFVKLTKVVDRDISVVATQVEELRDDVTAGKIPKYNNSSMNFGDSQVQQNSVKSGTDPELIESSENTTDQPTASIAKPLPTLAYDEVTKVSRTMHFDDFKACFQKGKFIASRVKPQYKTLLPKNEDFVWFRAQSDCANGELQDWFGNVRCSFDLVKFMRDNMNVNMFYIDCAYFGFSSASRILLSTRTQYPGAKKIDLDSLKFGDPLMFDGTKLMFLRKDVSSNRKWFGSHQTEVVIDAQTIDLGKLFTICDKVPVNHSRANRKNKNGVFVFHQCLIFNSLKRKICPSAWTVEETRKSLNQLLGIEETPDVES
ncbi:hypothetical protein HAZT_HAZT002229 [Hyalella azteca]|nr:hypothetical protein HAZT_HAZT002229 [Hyalella azteca]